MPNLSTRDNQMEQQPLSVTSSTGQSDSTQADTPLQVARQLHLIRTEAERGLGFLYDAEVKLADKEFQYERTLQLAFIEAQGTVADRTSISRLKASEAQLEVSLAKAELNRIRAKLKQLEMAQMSVQTQARLMESELRTLGR